METQHTIGYGGRQTTEECPEAIFIMSIQEMLQCCNVDGEEGRRAQPREAAIDYSFQFSCQCGAGHLQLERERHLII